MKDMKTTFCERLRQTGREGVENIISMLEELGFFVAPASTRFHLNREGGLLEHSVNVCDAALDIREMAIKRKPAMKERLPEESVVIAALLHDVCKADIYKPASNKMKIAAKLMPGASPYSLDYGGLLLGHGEKSVIMLLQNGLKMTDDEIIAIRWHMSAWDLSFQSGSSLGNYGKAKNSCQLLTVIQCADEIASSIMECK